MRCDITGYRILFSMKMSDEIPKFSIKKLRLRFFNAIARAEFHGTESCPPVSMKLNVKSHTVTSKAILYQQSHSVLWDVWRKWCYWFNLLHLLFSGHIILAAWWYELVIGYISHLFKTNQFEVPNIYLLTISIWYISHIYHQWPSIYWTIREYVRCKDFTVRIV